MCRKEWAQIRFEREPRINSTPVPHEPMFDQMAKRWAGKMPIGTNIERSKFKPKDWPMGAIFVPILGNVYAGRDWPGPMEQPEAYRRTTAPRSPFDPPLPRLQTEHERQRGTIEDTDRPRGYWAQINALKDARDISADQEKFREHVSKIIEGEEGE